MTPALRFTVFIAVVLSIWLAQHLYVGSRLLSLAVFAGGWPRHAMLAVMALGFLAYFAGRGVGAAGWQRAAGAFEYLGGLWMGLVFLLLAAFVVVDLVSLGGLVLKTWVPALRGAAVVAALVAVGAAWAGELRSPRVVRVELELPLLDPKLDGVAVLQLSDLHLGSATSRRRVERVLELVERTRPDIVAVTGDLVDGDVGAVERFVPMLQTIGAPLGVFAVLGNHEYYGGAERSRDLLHRAGFTILDNVAVEVAPSLVVAGVPDARGAAQTGGGEVSLARALASVTPSSVVVLLQHSPGDEAQAAAAGVDLMLNGHTHGGQLWPFHHLVARAYPHYAGVRRVGEMTQVVSRGAGVWGPPMRLFAPADVVLVTLRAAVTGG